MKNKIGLDLSFIKAILASIYQNIGLPMTNIGAVLAKFKAKRF